jgi:phytoene dehydrogenase-like protein
VRRLGFEVTVLEKQARPGGRSNVLEQAGFRADMGPTILVMKAAFEEMYRAIGQDMNQRLDMVQLDPNYRIYYHDDTWIDLYSNMAQLAQEVEKIEPGAAERLFRFIGEGAKKYELGMEFVDRNFDSLTDWRTPSPGCA